jgi:hypothetical protein
MVPNVAHELSHFCDVISVSYFQVKNAMYPVLYPATLRANVVIEPSPYEVLYNIQQSKKTKNNHHAKIFSKPIN